MSYLAIGEATVMRAMTAMEPPRVSLRDMMGERPQIGPRIQTLVPTTITSVTPAAHADGWWDALPPGTLPPGGVQQADGSLKFPDGSVVRRDGTATDAQGRTGRLWGADGKSTSQGAGGGAGAGAGLDAAPGMPAWAPYAGLAVVAAWFFWPKKRAA